MSTIPAAPHSARFWRAFAVTVRPYLMFLSLAAGLVGLALTDLGGAVFGFGAAFFLTYGLGQAVTDTFQTDTDALSAPYRPLVRDEVRASDVRAAALIGLAGCAVVFVIANPWNALPAAASVAGLVSYTWFKRRWWGGPAWNAGIVALLPLIGALSGGATPTTVLAEPKLWLAMGSAFATYVCFVALGYLKDVEADRATGYDTVAVRFGRRPTIVLSAAHAAVGLLASAMLVPGVQDSPPAFALWLVGWGLLFASHVRLWNVTQDRDAHHGVAWCALGFVAVHLGEAGVLRPDFAVISVAVFLLAIIAIRLRPAREQV